MSEAETNPSVGSGRDRVDAILDHMRLNRAGEELATEAVHIRLRRIAHRVETETRRRLQPLGMEFWELPILAGLIRVGGTMSVGGLQDLAQVTSGAITQRIGKLEIQGSVVRAMDPGDRRQVNVTITDRGRDRFTALAGAMRDVEGDLFAAVDPDLISRLARDLRTLALAFEGEDPGHR